MRGKEYRFVWCLCFVVALCLIVSHCPMALSEEQPSITEPAQLGVTPLAEEVPGGPREQPQTGAAEPEPRPPFLAGEPEAQEFNLAESAMKMLVALLLAIALFCIVIVVLKRFTRGMPIFMDRSLGRVIGRISLSSRAALYLVKVADKVLVVGVNPSTINLIAEIADQETVTEMERLHLEGAASRSPFANQLRQFQARFSGAKQAGEEEAKLDEHLRDIKDQMAKLSALIGGSENEEVL